MGDILSELESSLRSKTGTERIKPEEARVLHACKQKGILDFVLAAVGSSLLVTAATRRKLSRGMSLNLAVGSAFVTGFWRFDSSLESCLDHILKIEGSRIQRELANIIITKHGDDLSMVKLVDKYFFREEVFKDLNTDKPTFRWRQRNVYVDDSVSRTSEPPHAEDIANEEPNLQHNRSTTIHEDLFSDPLEHILGYPESSGEAGDTKDRELPRRRARHQRKASRRRQAHENTGDNST